MNSLLIASFKDESSARSAMKKLDDLAFNGEIDLYERTLIRKTPDGRCKVYRESGSAGWQTISGALLGSLVGLPAGPVGAVIGIMSGAVVGSVTSDRDQHEFGEDVMKSVKNDIQPGKVAIVAHIGERDPKFVDSILKRFDSIASRNDFGTYQGETEISGDINGIIRKHRRS